jgi:hypothetical protein
MVQAFVRIRDDTNQVLNMVKAKHGLKDKSEAINKVVDEYKKLVLDPLTKEESEIIKELLRIRSSAKKISLKKKENLRKEVERITKEKGERAAQEFLYERAGLS